MAIGAGARPGGWREFAGGARRAALRDVDPDPNPGPNLYSFLALHVWMATGMSVQKASTPSPTARW